MSWKRWLITVLSFAAAIGVSVYLVLDSWSTAGDMAALPITGHLLALGVMAVEVGARVLKLYYSAAALRIPFSIWTSLRTNLGGDFGAGITPSRSGSEPARFLILSEARMAPTAAILLLFTEMFLEMLSVLVIAIVLAVVFKGSGAIVGGVLSVACAYSVFVLVVGYAGFALAKKANGPPPTWAVALRLHAGRWRRIQTGLRALRGRLSSLSTARGGLIGWATILSALHVVARISVLPALVYSYDRTVDLAPLVLWSLALMYGANAAPAPAGGGLIEVAFRSSLGGVIPAPYFAATLIWWRFYTFYLLLLLGAFVAGRTVMRALRPAEPSARDMEETDIIAPAQAVGD
jgi:glycosyltransferase 2 family protein